MNTRRIFLVLTMIGALAMGASELDFYPQLSQGDHGRDLYSAQEVLRGKLPYKDFWWAYGPLMPYYYAFFYKFFGGTIGSFLLGKVVLKIACAVFFYLAASRMMAASVAFLAAMWFTQSQQDFFFTFSHIGGITAELLILFLLFSYIQRPLMRHLWLLLPVLFIYGLIKMNFALTSLMTALLTVALTDALRKQPWDVQKRNFYITASVIVPAAIAFIYWLLLKDLPLYQVRQCLPYFGDDQPHHFSPSVTIPYYFIQHWLTFTHSPVNMALGIVLHGATLMSIVLLCSGKLETGRRQKLLLCLGLLGMFFVLNFHEFVVSGVWYRTFWSLPFLFMFHFLMMSTAFSVLPALARRLIWAAFGALLLLGLAAAFFSTQQQKIPPHYLNGPHAKIYVGNEFEWTSTVNAVNAYLDQKLKPDELFFALPYDCIYYYLTGKESPTRQLIFFDHIKIPPQQELDIIRDLERRNVNYVLMSNRIASSETGLGIFGKTYCPILSSYIAQNFTPAARQGGNWQAEPGWGNNHGVLIFKRNKTVTGTNYF
ncbi:MAG: hypothetical protein HY591_04685 [Candidatus Omnitrophica bacterium]|nr:hypothetical protein [Candidatus Omnitrophota bacterium]